MQFQKGSLRVVLCNIFDPKSLPKERKKGTKRLHIIMCLFQCICLKIESENKINNNIIVISVKSVMKNI